MPGIGRFYLDLLAAVDRKGAKRSGLFFLWFAAGIFLIACVWTSLFIKGAGNSTLGTTDVLLVLPILALLWIAALAFGLITLMLMMAKRSAIAGEEHFSLGKWRFLRVSFKPWRTLDSEAPGTPFSGIHVWSHEALTTRSGTSVLEAALWYLLANQRLRLRWREEDYHFAVPWLRLSSTRRRSAFHAQFVAESASVAGEWESRILNAASKSSSTDESVEIFELIRTAFGNSTSKPDSTVLKVVLNELTMKDLADIDATERAEAAYKPIRDYIASHDRIGPGLTTQLRETISAAIKDRTDAS